MSVHPWCLDPSRDEAVRAAEDGRAGPLPTLEAVIAQPFAGAPKCSPSVSETGETQSGLRTERVTLEVTHGESFGVSHWSWVTILRLQSGESVRVVEEEDAFAPAPAIAGGTVLVNGQDMVTLAEFLRHTTRLTQEAGVARRERDAAIRERDELRTECERLRVAQVKAAQERDKAHEARGRIRSEWIGRGKSLHIAYESIGKLKARVASLEAAPAASGAAGTEPDYYVYENELGMIVYTSQKLVNDGWGGCTITPVYAAPQPATGWLTAEEREAVEWFCGSPKAITTEQCDRWKDALRNLLARSTPPEVVLPNEKHCHYITCSSRDADWLASLAAAGVPVKEVGRE